MRLLPLCSYNEDFALMQPQGEFSLDEDTRRGLPRNSHNEFAASMQPDKDICFYEATTILFHNGLITLMQPKLDCCLDPAKTKLLGR